MLYYYFYVQRTLLHTSHIFGWASISHQLRDIRVWQCLSQSSADAGLIMSFSWLDKLFTETKHNGHVFICRIFKYSIRWWYDHLQIKRQPFHVNIFQFVRRFLRYHQNNLMQKVMNGFANAVCSSIRLVMQTRSWCRYRCNTDVFTYSVTKKLHEWWHNWT